VPIVSKSVSHDLLEPSGPVTGLYRDCFTFINTHVGSVEFLNNTISGTYIAGLLRYLGFYISCCLRSRLHFGHNQEGGPRSLYGHVVALKGGKTVVQHDPQKNETLCVLSD
jgi:hypothetical protein